MAVNRTTSNSPDTEDVTVTLHAFEHINQVRVNIRLTTKTEGRNSDLTILAECWEKQPLIGEAKFLASVSATCLALNLRTLDAAVIHVLYLLDGKLAEEEFANAAKK